MAELRNWPVHAGNALSGFRTESGAGSYSAHARAPRSCRPPMEAHTPKQRTIVDKVLDKALFHMRRRLPYNRVSDNLFHRVLFYRKHHRLPSRELLWNDMWFRVKTSAEIEDPLRRLVSDKELVKQYVRET